MGQKNLFYDGKCVSLNGYVCGANNSWITYRVTHETKEYEDKIVPCIHFLGKHCTIPRLRKHSKNG